SWVGRRIMVAGPPKRGMLLPPRGWLKSLMVDVLVSSGVWHRLPNKRHEACQPAEVLDQGRHPAGKKAATRPRAACFPPCGLTRPRLIARIRVQTAELGRQRFIFVSVGADAVIQ